MRLDYLTGRTRAHVAARRALTALVWICAILAILTLSCRPAPAYGQTFRPMPTPMPPNPIYTGVWDTIPEVPEPSDAILVGLAVLVFGAAGYLKSKRNEQ